MFADRYCNRYTIALGIAVVLVAAWPALNILRALPETEATLAEAPSILANSVYGSTYYNARLRKIVDGYPFLGNPYFFEYRNEIAPAFFVADWIAAAPMFVGLSYNAAMIANVFFWSLVVAELLFALFVMLELPPFLAAAGSFVVYGSILSLMTAPVSMQTIFPFFFALLIALFLWLGDPMSKRRGALLVLTVTASCYAYTYLWQIALAAMFFVGIVFLLQRRFVEAKRLVALTVSIFALSSPLIIYTAKQVAHPLYWETMKRIGLITSHIPVSAAFVAGQWVVYIVALWLFAFRWAKELRDNASYRVSTLFFSVTGLALLLAANSSVISGKELEQAQHIARFMAPWVIIATLGFFPYLARYWRSFMVIPRLRKAALGILGVFVAAGVWWNFNAYSSYREPGEPRAVIAEFQGLIGPARWLDAREPEDRVIFVEPQDLIANYLSAMSRHYVIFYNGGILHLVSDQESIERYLVASYFRGLTLQDIQADFQQYAGVGNAVHEHKAYNRKIKICRLLQLPRFGISCGELTDAVRFRGEEYFKDIERLYKETVVPQFGAELKKFNVSYFVLRKARGDRNAWDARVSVFAYTPPVYEDNNYLIYKAR